MPTYWAFLLMLLPTGLALVLYTTAANSATQLGTDPQIRGRVMGVYMLVFLGGAPIGSPLNGWVAEQFGPRMSLISGGVISAIAAIMAGSCSSTSPGPASGTACGHWPSSASVPPPLQARSRAPPPPPG